jgi:hypothetical protein
MMPHGTRAVSTTTGGDIAGRYTDISLLYRLVSEPSFKTSSPRLVSQTARQQIYEFVIPAYPIATTGRIEYRVDFRFDGSQRSSPGIRQLDVVPQ